MTQYLCMVDGVVEYGSNDPNIFSYYQFIYAEEHADADVQYLVLTDEAYDQMFPTEDDD